MPRGPIPDDARLEELVTRLLSDARYASGARRFPQPLSDDEAAELAEALERDLDGGVASRAREAARRRLKIFCSKGCSVCCEEPVIVYLPEALAIARWLESPANTDERAWFEDAYRKWRAALGDAPDRLADLQSDDANRAAYEAAYRAQWKLRVMCAFNRDGACTIYPVRPLLCREGHALGTNEHCVAGSPIPAQRLTGGPVEAFMKRANLVLRAAHNALAARPNRAEMLCEQVHRLLTDGNFAEK
jgi:Fe-S-cluster containining protein